MESEDLMILTEEMPTTVSEEVVPKLVTGYANEFIIIFHLYWLLALS
jgi:hypothetical protein